MVITVTNVRRNSTAGNSFRYRSLGGVFVNAGMESCGAGTATGTGIGTAVLSGADFAGISLGLSVGSGASSGIGFSWIFCK